jgi:hypothetical protein
MIRDYTITVQIKNGSFLSTVQPLPRQYFYFVKQHLQICFFESKNAIIFFFVYFKNKSIKQFVAMLIDNLSRTILTNDIVSLLRQK